MKESMESLIARSSLGGHAWCVCRHPDLLHAGELRDDDRGGCSRCGCRKLKRMTPEQYLEWRTVVGHVTRGTQ